jgi:hypothetical protein
MTAAKMSTTYHNIIMPNARSNSQKIDTYEKMMNNIMLGTNDKPLNQILSEYNKDLGIIKEGDIINLKKNKSILDSFIVWNNEMIPLPQTIAGNQYKLIIPECITPTKFPIDYWYQEGTRSSKSNVAIEFVPVAHDCVISHIHKYIDKETHLKDCGMISEEDTQSIDLEQEYDNIYNFEFDNYQFELVDDFNFNDELVFVDFYDKEIISYPQLLNDKIHEDIKQLKNKYIIAK